MSDLYAAPESAREVAVGNQDTSDWLDCPYRYVMLTGTIASIVSATGLMVFFLWCDFVFGGYSPVTPAWVQFLYGTSFYSAGTILAVGFGLMSGQFREHPAKLLWLTVGGYFCLWISEMFILAIAGQISWLVLNVGTVTNITLRSATLCMFVCWMLDIRIRKWRLLALLLVGAPVWMLIFFCTGVFDGGLPEWMYSSRSEFNTAWTLVAAWQLWAMLLPPKMKTQERRHSGETFLPATFSLDRDAAKLDIEL